MAKSVARSARREEGVNRRAVAKMQKAGQTPLQAGRTTTLDAFQNAMSRVGLGTDNQSSFGGYGYNPITNIRITLDLAYRSSWVCRAVVQGRAKDMTRAGIDFESDLSPNDGERLQKVLNNKVWSPLRQGIQWGRLYGGAGVFIMIDGQKPETPLDISRIGRSGFKGLLPLDRWLVTPTTEDLVTDMGASDYGRPKYYMTQGDTPLKTGTKIHHTRFIRFEGDDLPYYQRLATMLWGMSVLEPVWDRLLAFDSTTQGIAQMVYRASIRNLYIEKWKEIVGAGGKRLDAQIAAIDWVRRMQGNEGLTVLDSTDRFESITYAFTGLDSVLIQMGQQLSGATRYPLVILFGQSPVGLNSTGESDIRNYYDSVLSDQNSDLRPGLTTVLKVIAASESIKLSDDFTYRFNPLWQLTDEQKAAAASQNTSTVDQAFTAGIIDKPTALRELKQQSRETGIWTNITEEQITEAENEPPPMPFGEQGLGSATPGPEMAGQQLGGGPSPLPPNPDQPSTSPEDRSGGQPSQGFLPRRDFFPSRGRRAFLPGEDDSSGAFEVGETERFDRKPYKPLVHIHHEQGSNRHGMVHLHLADTNLPGRETEFGGHRIVIEVEQGQKRTMGSSGGAVMAAPYGYFPNTKGNDGDAVDVFLGDNPKSEKVWVVEQVTPDTGEFHQHKVFLGFDDQGAVSGVFEQFYADGKGHDRWGKAREISLADFNKWLDRYRVQPTSVAV